MGIQTQGWQMGLHVHTEGRRDTKRIAGGDTYKRTADRDIDTRMACGDTYTRTAGRDTIADFSNC